jgi:hypothetical protein
MNESVSLHYILSDGSMKDKLWIIWNEAVTAKLRYQPGTWLETQENRKTLSTADGPAEVQTRCLLSTS